MKTLLALLLLLPSLSWGLTFKDGKQVDEGNSSNKNQKLGYFELSFEDCLLYTSPSPRDKRQSRMPSSA